MAKSKSETTVGSEFETTIIFPPKSVVEELAEAKRQTKKRTQSMNGTLGEKIGKAVEEKHLDRKAFSMACQLDAMDDERLHITFHSLLKYCEDLGVTKRATAQEELFEPDGAVEPEAKISDAKPAKGTAGKPSKPEKPKKDDKSKKNGKEQTAAEKEALLAKVGRGRDVAETAGKDDSTGTKPPLH
jgi:hypothetical protein